MSGMLIVTPNPAVDHTVRLECLKPGDVIRTGPGVSVAGGKGGNVTRAARLLGGDPSVLAFVPEIGGKHLQTLYAAEGFDLISVPVAGRVRTCTAMIEADGRVTLLNEPGAPVTDADWTRLMATMRGPAGAAASDGLIICSGSLPPGAPADGYAQIVGHGHTHGCDVIVDASREALAHSLRAGADLVCPNVSEAEAAISSMTLPAGATGAAPSAEPVHDDGDDVPERAAAAAVELLLLGATWAVVTAGAAGAAVAGPDYRAWLASPTVTVRNPIGAGDSFLAGVATARTAGRSWPDAIRRGLAAGSASVEQDAAGVVDPARVDELEQAIGR
ncbi:MAG: PfkB family carbohydrate kinase [Nakamurella sp.]